MKYSCEVDTEKVKKQRTMKKIKLKN